MGGLILYFRVEPDILSRIVRRGQDVLAPSLWLLVAFALAAVGCSEEPIELGEAEYIDHVPGSGCEVGSRPGGTGLINDQSTNDGIKYNIQTPSNYIATVAHPLLVFYSPARRPRSCCGIGLS